MMEVVWKSSMFGGYFIWIGVLVLYGLVQVTVSTAKTSLACVRNPSCNMMTLSCKKQHRISVMGHEYNYNEKSSQCTKDNSHSQCVIKERCKKQFNRKNLYPLYTSCSGLNTCTVAATSSKYNCTLRNGTVAKVLSDSTKVTYSCVNDGDILRFCKDRSTTTSKSVDIIFNGTDTHKSVQNQTCTCTVTGNSTDRIVLQDFRLLQPDNTSVCSSVKIKGFGRTCNVTKAQWRNFAYLKKTNLSAITLENLFAKNANDRPTMVWIKVKAGGNAAPLTVNCTAPSSGIPLTQPTTTTTTETTTTEQSTPSYTENDDKSPTSTNTKSSPDVIPKVVTKSSDVPSSTVTTDVPGDIKVAAQDSTDTTSSSVPAVAIVVPVLLICVGLATALGIWFWRRHRRGGVRQLTDTKHNLTYGRNGGPVGPCAETTKKASKNPQNKPPVNTEHLDDDDNYDYAMPADELKANEDEYNVLSLKSKPVGFDPSYDHLPNAKNEFQTDSDEYSHITNLSSPIKTDINASMDVYSHLERPSTSSQNASVTSDVMGIYSHLKGERPVQVTPTALATKSEDDTYDHALSFGATQRHNQSARTMNTGPLLSCNLDNSPSAQSGERPPDTDGDHEYFILERVQYKP